MYLNKAFVFGNLTRDPELRAMPNGMNVCNFSIATNRVFTGRDGKKQEQAEFHNIVVFGRQADVVNQYLKKGGSALVEGRIQTRSWEGKDGEKKYRTEIVADRVQFGPRSSGSGGRRSEEGAPEHEETPSGGGSSIDYPKDDINPDDIPF
jgi:single-strand DNA-binding protein